MDIKKERMNESSVATVIGLEKVRFTAFSFQIFSLSSLYSSLRIIEAAP